MIHNLFTFFGFLNWVDYFFVALFIKGIFLGRKNGIFKEFIHLVGYYCALNFALHYYYRFGNLLGRFVVPTFIKEFVGFIVILVMIGVIFYLIHEGLSAVFRFDVHPRVFIWGGIVLSFLKSFLLCCAVYVLLLLFNNAAVYQSARNSFFSNFMRSYVLDSYGKFYSQFVSVFFSREPINYDLFEITSHPRQTKQQEKSKQEKKANTFTDAIQGNRDL